GDVEIGADIDEAGLALQALLDDAGPAIEQVEIEAAQGEKIGAAAGRAADLERRRNPREHVEPGYAGQRAPKLSDDDLRRIGALLARLQAHQHAAGIGGRTRTA